MALDSTVKVKFLGDAANLAREAARASRATDQVGRSAESAHKHLSGMAKGLLAGAGIGAAAVGLEKLVNSTVNAYKNAAGEASKLSRLTGLAAEDASRLGFAAHETGTDMDDFAKALGILSKNLNGADKAQTVLTKTHHLAIEQVPKLVKGHIQYVAQLKNVTDTQKKTVAGTQSLGFALRDASGHLLPMSTLLPKIADKFKDMVNGPEKTALALKLFGRGGAALLPFLNQGAAGLAKFGEEADKLGITMSGKDVAAYRTYIASQRQFKAAIEGAKISLGRELFPVFAAWSKALADNGPVLAGYARTLGEKIGPAAQRAATAIKDFFKGVRDGTGAGGEARDVLTGIGGAVRFLVDHAGGLKKAAEGMAAYWAATKLAALWTAGLALAAPSAATGIESVGAASKLAFPEVAALAGVLVAAFEAWKAIQGLRNDQKSLRAMPNTYDNLGTLARAEYDKDPGGYMRAHPDFMPPSALPSNGRIGPDKDETAFLKTKHGRNAVAVAITPAEKVAAATKAAADKTAAANKAALDKELATAAAAQKVADVKAAAADALQKATDKLKEALTSRVDEAKGIRDSLVSSNSVVRSGVSWTAKDLLSRFTVTMAKVKRFQTAIAALVHKGYDRSIIEQVAAAGVQGGMGTAVGLAHASSKQVGQFNATQRALEQAASRTGDRVASTQGPINIAIYLDGKKLSKEMVTAINQENARLGFNGHQLAS